MRLLFLLFSVVPLAAHAQAPAMRPPPSTGPLIQQQPPSYPGNPVYTPPGAGASHGSLPGTQGATLPPSPNKRPLDDEYSPNRKPGLWAADGAPQASATTMPPLFGVSLPYPPGIGNGEVSRRLADSCVESMSDAAKQAVTLPAILRLSPVVRECMAAHALKVCADEMYGRHRRTSDADHPPTEAEEAQTEALMVAANALKVDRCRQAAFEEAGASINESEAALLNRAIDQWQQTNKRGKSSRFTH